MKLNSKSGATLAAAAATLFLAGSVVSTVSTPANAAAGQVHGRQRLQGPERLQGLGEFLQGPERLQGPGLLGGFREGSAPPWAPSSSRVDRPIRCEEGPALPGPRCFDRGG